MGGDQRTGAGGVQRHGRAAEVVEVRHPVGDDRTRGAGDRVRVRGRRVGDRQELVVVVRRADEDADVAAPQARRRDAGVLQCLPGELERHPLLRVDVVGFHLRQREELGVEALDVGQVAASGGGLGHPLGDARFGEELRPAAFGQIGDRVAALQQRLPHLSGGVHVAGESGGHAHDRDVLDIGRARPVLVVVELDLGLALDDDRGERLDGRMAEGHRRGQRDTGEVLDIAGHGDRVARGQPQFHHRGGLVDRVRRLPGCVGHPVAQPFAHFRHRHIGAGRGVGRFGRF